MSEFIGGEVGRALCGVWFVVIDFMMDASRNADARRSLKKAAQCILFALLCPGKSLGKVRHGQVLGGGCAELRICLSGVGDRQTVDRLGWHPKTYATNLTKLRPDFGLKE